VFKLLDPTKFNLPQELETEFKLFKGGPHGQEERQEERQEEGQQEKEEEVIS
jgi:hypothetical protein